MTSGVVNENAEEKKTMLEPEAMVEVLPKTVQEPPLYVKIRDVSSIALSKIFFLFEVCVQIYDLVILTCCKATEHLCKF